MRAKASVSEFLNQYLEAMARLEPLEVLTRPVTKDGLRVAEKKYQMDPVTEPGLDHIYQTRLGTRPSEMQQTVASEKSIRW